MHAGYRTMLVKGAPAQIPIYPQYDGHKAVVIHKIYITIYNNSQNLKTLGRFLL